MLGSIACFGELNSFVCVELSGDGDVWRGEIEK